MTRGVPQGSVLGPILYVIYVNKLPAIMNQDNCNNNVHVGGQKLFTNNCKLCGQMPMYANDSTVIISTKTRFQSQERITELITKIKSFLDAKSLSMNLGKTEIVETMVRQKRVCTRGLPPPALSIQTRWYPQGHLRQGILQAPRHQSK